MKTSSLEEVLGLYEGSAESYAQMMDAEIDLPIYADVLGRLAERIADLPGPLIDTSCGSGHMLARYHERYESGRALVGIDLAPAMVEIAGAKLGAAAEVLSGDMRKLGDLESASAAAVVSFYAIHHLEPDEVRVALREWHRVLGPGGQLLLATWEGAGAIDYGDASDVVALRYTGEQVAGWVQAAGFSVERCVVEPVEEFPMDAIYLEGTRP